jgi:hypothetical protein
VARAALADGRAFVLSNSGTLLALRVAGLHSRADPRASTTLQAE